MSDLTQAIVPVQYALRYSQNHHWRVFPCAPRGKRPLTPHGVLDATMDEAQIRAWWAKWPDANIGIATGQGLVVLDIDGPEGAVELKALVALHGPLPKTLVSQTGRGAHLFFSTTKPLRNAAKGALHVRGEGGYVVAPPSLHASGRRYAWLNDEPVQALPEWLEKHLASGSQDKGVFNWQEELPAHLRERAPSGLLGRARNAIHEANTATYEEIREALFKISPDCDRDTWIKALMAVKSTGIIGEGGEDIGLDLVTEWSSMASVPGKYLGETHIEQQWTSLKPDGGITLATLFHLSRKSFSKFQGCNDSVESNANAIDIDVAELLASPAPPREWLVQDWIPADEVTLLGGEGGMGKSTLIIQLAMAMVTGMDWLGLPVTPGRVLYCSAEDGRKELHWRLQEVAKHYPTNQENLQHFKIKNLSLTDAILATFDKSSRLTHSALFESIVNAALEQHATCIILDAIADMYGGNESERREVRAFISMLRQIALRYHIAVIFLAHPSVDAIKTGRGYSGSTHWNNAVRSRLYFHNKEDGEEPIGDTRVLEVAKSNWARKGAKVELVWLEGRYVEISAARELTVEHPKLETLFLRLLNLRNTQNRPVNQRLRTSNYAPKEFARMPEVAGVREGALEKAMERLFSQGKIKIESYRAANRHWQERIILC